MAMVTDHEDDRPVRLTREARSRARRAITRMLTVEHREFPSSDGSRTYRAVILHDGKTMCDCRGWTIKKAGMPRQCMHVAMLVSSEKERPVLTDGEFLFVAQYRPDRKGLREYNTVAESQVFRKAMLRRDWGGV